MKIIDKYKRWKADGKPIREKTKGRLQGLAVGAALATIGFFVAAVAVGCSSTAVDGEKDKPVQSAPYNANAAITEPLPSGYYTFVEQPDVNTFSLNGSFSFLSHGQLFTSFYVDNSDSCLVYDDTYAYEYPSWSSPEYRVIHIMNDVNVSTMLSSWFNMNSTFSDTEPVSSEATSSEAISSEEASSSEVVATSSVEEDASRVWEWTASDSVTLPATPVSYSVDFRDANGNQYTSISLSSSAVRYDGTTAYNGSSWNYVGADNITATGGEDATDAALLEWLRANGSLVVDSPAVSSFPSSSGDTSSTALAENNPYSVTLAEGTAFSAWVKNPANGKNALTYDIGAPFILYTDTPSGDVDTYITTAYTEYEVGDFYVEGNPSVIFNKIGITTQTLSVDNAFVTDGEDVATKVTSAMFQKGAFSVVSVKYVGADDSVVAAKLGSRRATLDNVDVLALTGMKWSAAGFRHLVFLDDSATLDVGGYTAPVAWWMENNALESSAAVSVMVLGNSSTGVFSLIGNAFGAIGSFLGIALIPGLTIGTLMFVPLVVMVIVAIVKLLAK